MSDGAAIGVVVEEWRPIPGSDGLYSVSIIGSVRSEPDSVPRTGRQRGRIIGTYPNRKGYMRFRMCLPGNRRIDTKVHAAVAAAFIGPRPDGLQVNHKNGNKLDNRPVNLEYVTGEENIRHAYQTGLCANRARGERNSKAKLTADDVRQIRRRAASECPEAISGAYGVTKENIRLIINRRTWKHVA